MWNFVSNSGSWEQETGKVAPALLSRNLPPELENRSSSSKGLWQCVRPVA